MMLLGHGENSVFNIEQELEGFWSTQKRMKPKDMYPVLLPSLPIFDFRRARVRFKQF